MERWKEKQRDERRSRKGREKERGHWKDKREQRDDGIRHRTGDDALVTRGNIWGREEEERGGKDKSFVSCDKCRHFDHEVRSHLFF